MTGRTETAVHSPDQMLTQRWNILTQDRCALCGLSIYTQLFIGMAMYLYGHVSTPSAISILLAFPYGLLLTALARNIARRADPEKGVLDSLEPILRRTISFFFLVMHLFDGQLIFYSLCAALMDVMPDHSLWKITLIAALALAWVNSGNREDPLARLARFLRWLVFLLLVFCLASAIPYGKSAHFFPMLGYGWASIGKGGLWTCGAVWGAAWPLLMPQHGQALSSILKRRKTILLPVCLSVLVAAVTALFSAWLMPLYALAREETLGWRMLLVTNMTPSIPVWSLEAMALLLLFFLTLSYSITQAAHLLAHVRGKKQPPFSVYALLTLCLVPLSTAQQPEILERLNALALARGPAMLVVLVILSLAAHHRKPVRKEAA